MEKEELQPAPSATHYRPAADMAPKRPYTEMRFIRIGAAGNLVQGSVGYAVDFGPGMFPVK